METHKNLRIEKMFALRGGDEQVIRRGLTPHQPLPSVQLPGREHLRQRTTDRHFAGG